MRTKKIRNIVYNDKGSVLSLFVVILLCMTFLATATVTLAQTQFTLAKFSRQTSNSYHLARSGAEKVVDSMNKEVAKVLPQLMAQASDVTHTKLLAKNGVVYTGDEPYTGTYVGKEYSNQYEIELKKLIYNHIKATFVDKPISEDYKATNSDVKTPINVATKVYSNGSPTGSLPEDVREKVKKVVGGLAKEEEVGTTDKDAFAVEVTARAKDGTKTSLAKSMVIGTIDLDQVIDGEQLIEEYKWTGNAYPEALQSAVISFGDFIIHGDYNAKVHGDIHVRGTQGPVATPEDAKAGNFPEPDQSGGIVISDGGNLYIAGNALVVNNIQTTNSPDQKDKPSTITITKDAIANTIAINDHSTETSTPWESYVRNNKITIGGNVFMDNDIRIDRYVDKGEIKVGHSVFGISDGDSKGIETEKNVYVNPNKSSGIYAVGKDCTVQMDRAFVGGQAFINFKDGNGFHKLHESAGEPFEDVYYLEEYRTEYGESKEYIEDFGYLVDTKKIKVGENDKLLGYAPSIISAGGKLNQVGTFPMENKGEAQEILYSGLIRDFSSDMQKGLTSQSDWANEVWGTEFKWESAIKEPIDFYGGNNLFHKNFLPEDFEDKEMLGYKGLQGYMLGKRGVFYNKLERDPNSTNGYEPKAGDFNDLVILDMFDKDHTWSRNNPVLVNTSGGNINLDISDYNNIPTAIICTNEDAVISLTSSGTSSEFTGIIITPGRVEIQSQMTINGVVIVGSESKGAPREEIRSGKHAGIKISAQDVTFNYDMENKDHQNMIFDIRCLDKSLQRKLYDALKITNYKAIEQDKDKIDIIFGEEDKKIAEFSDESVIRSDHEGIQLVMKSLKKL